MAKTVKREPARKPPAKGKASTGKAAGGTAEAPRWRHGAVYWSEMNAHDVAAVKAFYEKALGWRYEAMPMATGTYWIIRASRSTGEPPVGGLFELKGPEFRGVPDHWLTYIAVDDVDARVRKAVAAGGKILRPAFDIPGVGRIAIIEQPGGGMVGWMTPAPPSA
jgi:hypothetical protein